MEMGKCIPILHPAIPLSESMDSDSDRRFCVPASRRVCPCQMQTGTGQSYPQPVNFAYGFAWGKVERRTAEKCHFPTSGVTFGRNGAGEGSRTLFISLGS